MGIASILPPVLMDGLSKLGHKVYATAVAGVDEYHKVIDEDAVDFTTSRQEELNGLLKSTLEAVCLEETSDENICGTKWLDKVKPDGSLKSRLVVQGFTQVWLKDYHDTFSAVASLTVFRIMINLAAILGWEIYTIDVSQAYTQGELMETIYIRAPKTHLLPRGMVYKLLRPLYDEASRQVLVPSCEKNIKRDGLVSSNQRFLLFHTEGQY
tara:strand:- start:408 stop:1040 length:633 start_codon:yes stop_codon:yes gene_type:complete